MSISNILAEIYLHGFYNSINNISDFYARYVDDILTISEGDITDIKESVEDDLDSRGGLELSCEKSYITSIQKRFSIFGICFRWR